MVRESSKKKVVACNEHDMAEIAQISENEQRVSNEIAELERKLAERWRQGN